MSWVQACDVVRSGDGGSARAALDAIGGELGLSCEAAPPADLSARATALSRTWFGRDEGATIDGMPARVPFAVAQGG